MSILLKMLIYIDIALAFLMVAFILVRGYVCFVIKTNAKAQTPETKEEKIAQLLIGDLEEIKQIKKTNPKQKK